MNNDIDGHLQNELDEKHALEAKLVAINDRIRGHTGKDPGELIDEHKRSARDEECQKYLKLYAGMNLDGKHPEHQDMLKSLAEGDLARRAPLLAWLKTRARDFELFDPPGKILETLLIGKPWEGEPPGGG
jgi:hypothetical protein